MNCVLFDKIDYIEPNIAQLSDRRFNHIKNVIKPILNQKLLSGDVNGKIGNSEIIELSEKYIKLKTLHVLDPPKKVSSKLIIGLPRPKNIGRIIESITSLGFSDIHFIHSYRVEKSFWTSKELSLDNINFHARLGLEQSIDTIVPQFHFHRYFKPFIEDIAPTLIADNHHAKENWIFHPHMRMSESQNVANTSPDSNLPHIIAIGTEGGWIDYEVNEFKKINFTVKSLGPRVLKLEQAIPYITGLCQRD